MSKDDNVETKRGGKRDKKEVTYQDMRLHRDADAETKLQLQQSIAKLGAAMITSPVITSPVAFSASV